MLNIVIKKLDPLQKKVPDAFLSLCVISLTVIKIVYHYHLIFTYN